MKEMENSYVKNEKAGLNCLILFRVLIGWFELQLWILLVDLNHKFECDWLTIKFSDEQIDLYRPIATFRIVRNNSTSDLVEKGVFKEIKIEEMEICNSTSLLFIGVLVSSGNAFLQL